MRDYDACLYCREYDSGFLVGGFPKEAKPLFSEKIPEEFAFQELSSDWNYFSMVLLFILI